MGAGVAGPCRASKGHSFRMATDSPQFTTAGNVVAMARRYCELGAEGMAKARQLLERELRDNPSNAEALDLEVELLVEAGDTGRAHRLVEEYLRYYPHCSLASSRLGWVLWKKGKREEALAEARASLARDPSHRRTRKWFLEWAEALGRHDLIVEITEAALRDSPEDVSLKLPLARAYAKSQRVQEAREALEEVLGREPENAEAAGALAELHLGQNQTQPAMDVLSPFLARADCPPALLLKGGEAAFRANLPAQALELIERLVCGEDAGDETFMAEVYACMDQQMGTAGAERYALEKLRAQAASDSFALSFLEAVGGRGNRGRIADIFSAIKDVPLRYPRTMARFLSTYHSAPSLPGAVERWVRTHQGKIEENATLWGGVGAWHFSRGRWEAAAEHLIRWYGRPGVKPWMLLLLGRAYEAMGRPADANEQYRHALTMEPDHSEVTLRSRLAFNLAMEGMPGAGKILIDECTSAGRELATVEDLLRMFAVETLVEAASIREPHNLQPLFADAVAHMRSLARKDPYTDGGGIIRAFRGRCERLLACARQLQDPEG